ncbi:MAG: phosphatase PAP2 family protein [Lachnospiraceae bacterium]|nr:phosphatase PAP2 family protein [Lachnospiraceae bacterium]
MDLLYALQVMRENIDPSVTEFFMFVSDAMILVIPIGILAVYWSVEKEIGKKLITELVYCFWFNGVAKLTACIYRPWVLDKRLHVFDAAAETATGYSFPSAHTSVTVIGFANLAICARKKVWKIISIALIIMVMISRMWLGCHSIWDVIGGAVISLILMLIVKIADWKLDGNKNKPLVILIIAVVLSVLTIIYIESKSYPLDYDAMGNLIVDPDDMKPDTYMGIAMILGWGIGNFIEDKFIKFTTDGTKWQKVLRTVIGAVLFLTVYSSVKYLVPSLNASLQKFVRMFAASIVGMAAYPWLFMKWRNRKNVKASV